MLTKSCHLFTVNLKFFIPIIPTSSAPVHSLIRVGWLLHSSFPNMLACFMLRSSFLLNPVFFGPHLTNSLRSGVTTVEYAFFSKCSSLNHLCPHLLLVFLSARDPSSAHPWNSYLYVPSVLFSKDKFFLMSYFKEWPVCKKWKYNLFALNGGSGD